MRKKVSLLISLSLELVIVIAFALMVKSNDKTVKLEYKNKNVDVLKYVNQDSLLFDSFEENGDLKFETLQKDLSNNDASKQDVKVLEEVKNDDETLSVQEISYEVIESYLGTLTGYGNDCVGCSHRTATSYDISSTITYNDSEFGEVRIVAADRSIPFYSIIRISNMKNMEPIIAIVLDRGGTVGFGEEKVTTFDLLFNNEKEANKIASLQKGVLFEMLREGK